MWCWKYPHRKDYAVILLDATYLFLKLYKVCTTFYLSSCILLLRMNWWQNLRQMKLVRIHIYNWPITWSTHLYIVFSIRCHRDLVLWTLTVMRGRVMRPTCVPTLRYSEKRINKIREQDLTLIFFTHLIHTLVVLISCDLRIHVTQQQISWIGIS